MERKSQFLSTILKDYNNNKIVIHSIQILCFIFNVIQEWIKIGPNKIKEKQFFFIIFYCHVIQEWIKTG